MKIGVIGLGAVGSACINALLQQRLARELFLYDIKPGLASASARDLEDALEYCGADTKIYAASSLAQLRECELIVLAYTATINADRTLELRANYEALVPMIKALEGFSGIYLIATNPNDSIVYFTQRLSALSPARVLGSGTALDSARLRIELASKIGINYKNINAFMLAEHGDTQFLCESLANINGKPLAEFGLNLDAIEEKVRFKGGEIFSAKGKTEFGIGATLARIIRAIKFDENVVLPLSFTQANLAYSRPVVLGKSGIKSVPELRLSEREKEKLELSKNYILKTISSIINFI